MKKDIPNFLTIIRGLLTLIIIGLFFIEFNYQYILIYIFFIIASLTDYFDGILARRWKVVSRFGKMFDPLFDKILTLSLYIMLFSFSGMPQIIFILLFLREIIVDGLKNYLLSYGISTPAMPAGKIKMVCQVLMLNFALLYLIFFNSTWLMSATYAFGIVALFFAYLSGWVYARKFWEFYKKK